MSAFDQYRDAIVKMQIGDWNSELCYIDSSTPSTELMTRLRCGTKGPNRHNAITDPYDLLVARKHIRKYRVAIDLLVLYDVPSMEIYELFEESIPSGSNEMTFSEFKKTRYWFWSTINSDRTACEIPFDNDQVVKLWSHPYVLKAVTDFDKDFRKEWRNGYLEYEGNNFGDTSTFYIIGSLSRRRDASGSKKINVN